MTEDNLKVRMLELSDMPQMSQWGTHEDPRFFAYNFPYKRQIDYLLWYRSKKKAFRRYIYGVFLGERLIGYITLKHIKWIRREAQMGVSFDPDFLEKGYGTKAIQMYLELVFSNFRLDTIKLKTAGFNYRGQRCYHKVGFVPYETKFEPFEDQSQRFDLLLNFGDFQMVADELWTDYIYMRYDRPVKNNASTLE